MNNTRLFLTFGLLCCLRLGFAPVQAAPADADNAAPAALEEIVVTAQKRQELLQDVPIAITAITASSLATNRIETTADLPFLVPALVYNNLGGYAQPFLRGVGSDFTAPNADASVATYIDGAYVANDQATITNLLGVERIEVLEGPQGTLYGRNAVGGAINIVTLSPSQDVDGQVSLGVGDYSRREISGYLSGPVTSDLSVGLYAAGTERNTFITRIGPGFSSDAQDEKSSGVRLKAIYTPTSWLKVTAEAEDTNTTSYESNALRAIQPNAAGFLLFGAPLIIDKYVDASSTPVFTRTNQESQTLRAEADLGWGTLESITNHRRVEAFLMNNVNGTLADLYFNSALPDKSTQWSQEFHLVSPDSSAWKWLVGLYYYNENSGFDPLATSSSVLLPPGLGQTDIYSNAHTESAAAFAQTTIPLGKLNLTLGARYSSDLKEFSADELFYTSASIATCEKTNQIPVSNCGTFLQPPEVYPDASKRWNKATPKATLDYKIDDTLLYATYAQGYKSGAYNLSSPATPGPVNPETLTDYEIGSKSDFIGGRLRVNTSFYFYDFKNLQVQIVDFADGGQTVQENAAAAQMYGFELSTQYAITTELKASFGASLEHSKYTQFNDFSGVDALPTGNVGVTVDATGNRVQRTPEHVFTASLDYNNTIATGGTVHGSLGGYFNGGYFWTAQNTFRQPAYTLVNATIGYTLPNMPLTFSLWGTNLTNAYYATNVLALAFFGTDAQDAPPRMYGLTVTYKLGGHDNH